MDNAIEIRMFFGTIDGAYEALAKSKANGENVYIDFNGKKLYSMLDSLDDCYVKVTGKTKAEFEEAKRQWQKEYDERELKEELEALEKMPARIERGKSMISPELHKKWEECVKIRTSDLYHGFELDNALDIMESLANDSFEEAYQKLNDANHSGCSYAITMSIITSFSDKGEDFKNWIADIESSKEPVTE